LTYDSRLASDDSQEIESAASLITVREPGAPTTSIYHRPLTVLIARPVDEVANRDVRTGTGREQHPHG
jgi:hypothetical protein